MTRNLLELEEGDIEILFDKLSAAVDEAGREHESLFLAKLVLLMAREINDTDRVTALIEEARILHDN